LRASGDTNDRFKAFLKGLNEAGFVDGHNVVVDSPSPSEPDQLPALAAAMVERKVAVIYGNLIAAIAAKTVTQTIPIVFTTTDDPIALGVVGGLNRPGGNVTGVRLRAGEEPTKLLELIHELVPTTTTVGLLINPSGSRMAELDAVAVVAAGHTMNITVIVARANTEDEFGSAIASLVHAKIGALLINDTRYFDTHRNDLIALTQRYGLAAVSSPREFALAGGLASYGANIDDGARQGGVYVGRILKGENPGDLPIVQPTKFDLLINLKTAKALGLTVRASLLARADEVIE
jgi:putative tryptophan/tyrosine transport system substrate-binding protein